MASLTTLLLPPAASLTPRRLSSSSSTAKPSLSITCKATKDAEESTSSKEIAAAVGGLISNPVIGWSLYALKTTGCGLPPGPGGSLGALEGVSYLVVAGIVAWSLYTKVKTGSGLPNGPYGLLGAAEGLSYLTVLAIVVVFGLQFAERGYIPGPLPADQCFG